MKYKVDLLRHTGLSFRETEDQLPDVQIYMPFILQPEQSCMLGMLTSLLIVINIRGT